MSTIRNLTYYYDGTKMPVELSQDIVEDIQKLIEHGKEVGTVITHNGGKAWEVSEDIQTIKDLYRNVNGL